MDNLDKITFQQLGQIVPQKNQGSQLQNDSKITIPADKSRDSPNFQPDENDNAKMVGINPQIDLQEQDAADGSILGKRKKSNRTVIKNRKYDQNNESNDQLEQIVKITDSKIDENQSESQNDQDEDMDDGQINTNQQRNQASIKKSNFTRSQTSILKKWFIQHAENPYLKEESRNELAIKTGLEPRQVSNWFTNVRKRIWQPIKKKNKNKGAKDLMLKVKLRLESNSNSRASSSERSSSPVVENLFDQKDVSKQAISGNTILINQDPARPKFNAFKLLENGLYQTQTDVQNLSTTDVINGKSLRSLPQPINQQETNQQKDFLFKIPHKQLHQNNQDKSQLFNSLKQNLSRQPSIQSNVQNFAPPTVQQTIADQLKKLQVEFAQKQLQQLLEKGGLSIDNNYNNKPFQNNINTENIVNKEQVKSNKTEELFSLGQNQVQELQQHLNNLQQTSKQQPTYESPASGDERVNQKLQLSQSPKAATGEQYISDQNNVPSSHIEIWERFQKVQNSNQQNLLTRENKRVVKENSKDGEQDNEAVQNGLDAVSDATAKDQKKRSEFKMFMNQSRVLRFREKMQNVKLWRNSAIAFAAENETLLEIPPAAEGPIEEVDFEQLAQVEKEFSQFENKEKKDGDSQNKDIEKDLYKRRKLNETDTKDIVPAGRRLSIVQAELDDSVPHGATSVEIPLSLPRSKSLSNNRSARSSKSKLQEDSNGNMAGFSQGFPYQFIPIIMICCPSIVCGKACNCGYDSYYPANAMYSTQVGQFLQNQHAIFGQMNNPSQYQGNGNSGQSGAGGSGASGYGESGVGGAVCRNANSGSNPSNIQGSSVPSWQTTAQNPLNFIALLNALNPLSNQKQISQEGDNQMPSVIQSVLQALQDKKNEQTDVVASKSNNVSQSAVGQEKQIISTTLQNPNEGTHLQQQFMDMIGVKNSSEDKKPDHNQIPDHISFQEQTRIPETIEGNIVNIPAFMEIKKGFSHLQSIQDIKNKISNDNQPQPAKQSLNQLASVVSMAAEMIEQGKGRPSDQNLNHSVKNLVQSIQDEISAIKNQQSCKNTEIERISKELSQQLRELMQNQNSSNSDPSGSGGSVIDASKYRDSRQTCSRKSLFGSATNQQNSGTSQENQQRFQTAPTTNQTMNSNLDISRMDAQQALQSQQIIQSLALDKQKKINSQVLEKLLGSQSQGVQDQQKKPLNTNLNKIIGFLKQSGQLNKEQTVVQAQIQNIPPVKVPSNPLGFLAASQRPPQQLPIQQVTTPQNTGKIDFKNIVQSMNFIQQNKGGVQNLINPGIIKNAPKPILTTSRQNSLVQNRFNMPTLSPLPKSPINQQQVIQVPTPTAEKNQLLSSLLQQQQSQQQKSNQPSPRYRLNSWAQPSLPNQQHVNVVAQNQEIPPQINSQREVFSIKPLPVQPVEHSDQIIQQTKQNDPQVNPATTKDILMFNNISSQIIKAFDSQSKNQEDNEKLMQLVTTLLQSTSHMPVAKELLVDQSNQQDPQKLEVVVDQHQELTLDPLIHQQKQLAQVQIQQEGEESLNQIREQVQEQE